MDLFQLLDFDALRPFWRASRRWHAPIAAQLAAVAFAGEWLFAGDRSTLAVIRRLPTPEHRAKSGLAGVRFAYLNHYYSMRALYDYGWLLSAPADRVATAMAEARISGMRHFRESISRGRGIIAFSAHVGCFFNFLFCERITTLLEGRTVVILVPGASSKRKRLMLSRLEAACDRVSWVVVDVFEPMSALRVYRALEEGAVVGCNLDYAYPSTRNEVVRFLGADVPFPLGAVKIGARTEATFLPCFSYLERGQTVLEFGEPIVPQRKTDLTALTARVWGALEKKISEIPEQWTFWINLVTERHDDQRGRKPRRRRDPGPLRQGGAGDGVVPCDGEPLRAGDSPARSPSGDD